MGSRGKGQGREEGTGQGGGRRRMNIPLAAGAQDGGDNKKRVHSAQRSGDQSPKGRPADLCLGRL